MSNLYLAPVSNQERLIEMAINDPIITPSTPITRSRGAFAAGEYVVFCFDFPDINGILYDPTDIAVTIYDPSSTAILTKDSLERVETGQFALTWTIPTDATPGLYILTMQYNSDTINGIITSSFNESFTITEEPSATVNGRLLAQRSFLEESLLDSFQRIPVYDEPLQLNKDRTKVKSTFPRWNQPAGIIVHVNGDVMETGYTVDYLRGIVTFDNPLTTVDEVTVSYNFRWFTDAQLEDYIIEGINWVNIWPPQTSWSFYRIPGTWIVASSQAAAIMAFRKLMADLLLQEPAKVFGGLERAEKMFANLETLKKNYEDTLFKMLEQKKNGPYVGLHMTITTPEFTLPGGRSRWFRMLFSTNSGS